MKLASKFSGGFPYRDRTICYIEVKQDGTIADFPHRCECDLTFVEEAHFNALYKGSRIYAVLSGNIKFNELYEIDDLAAFAEAFSLTHYAKHKHSFHWSTKEFRDTIGDTTWVTIKMHCGCVLSERNLADFAQLVYEQLGWKVVLSGGVSHCTNARGEGKHFTIEVESKSVKGGSGKFNVPKKSYC